MTKRAVIYARVSTLDQHPETQTLDLRQLAAQRGLAIIREYTDHGISGARVKRPALGDLLRDARRAQFDVVLVWACDRLARSTRHFLEVLDEFNHLGIEFISYREALDSSGPLGRAFVTIIGAIAELERNLIIERVRAGMRRARLEGRRLGRRPLEIDRPAVRQDRNRGLSLRQIAKAHGISRATVSRILKEHNKETHSPAEQVPGTPHATVDQSDLPLSAA
jgi:DNA invertase Pin-like site-specific DNA recombinase